MEILINIQNRIYEIRGERIMLDRDLANLYGVETRVFNQAVNRNIDRFPDDFMFRLKHEEWRFLKTKIEANELSMSSQSVMTSIRKRPNTALPFAFTEQGVAMLSGILHSSLAVKMNIAIMRAFVEIRKVLAREIDIKEQLKQIRERIGEHDVQLNQIYDAFEYLLDEKAAQKNWEERDKIGFRN